MTTTYSSLGKGRVWLALGLIATALGLGGIVGPVLNGWLPTSEAVILLFLGLAGVVYWSLVRTGNGGGLVRLALSYGLIAAALGFGGIVGPAINGSTPAVLAVVIAFLGLAGIGYWTIERRSRRDSGDAGTATAQ